MKGLRIVSFGAALAALTALGGCASTSSLPETTGATRSIEVQGMAGRLQTSSSTSATVARIAYPIDRVWKVLPAAFDSLGVPIASVDPAKHVMGNEGFKLRQRLGKTTLSRFLDCGQTQIGPNADTYEVYLTVLTQVTAVPGAAGAPATSSIATTFEAMAKPITFAQDYSKCSTRGLFESRLVEAVKAQLAK